MKTERDIEGVAREGFGQSGNRLHFFAEGVIAAFAQNLEQLASFVAEASHNQDPNRRHAF